MAAPTIPPIRLGLIGTGLAVGKLQAASSTMGAPPGLVFTRGAIGNHTASCLKIPVPPEPNDMRLYGTEGVLVLAGLPRQRIRSSASFAA